MEQNFGFKFNFVSQYSLKEAVKDVVSFGYFNFQKLFYESNDTSFEVIPKLPVFITSVQNPF
jgi:hypothetical protein